jgi:nucleotide-binding universal stress UspA family protein
MSEQNDELTIRRILVALDASRHSLAAMEAAAELAASMKAELQGLFVEDINLLRVAGSCVAREVSYPFGVTARLDPARMERQLRAQAARARKALAAACERREIKWSFRVVRGEVAPEVLAAAGEADMLSLGKASRPLVRQMRLGSTALAAVVQAPRSVLLLQREATIRPPVVVTYDGSPTARQALMMAARLAQNKGGYLIVLSIADAPDTIQRMQSEASDLLRGRRLLVRYRRLASAGVATLTQVVRAEGSGILVLSSTILHRAKLQKLLYEVDCPVLLVRLTPTPPLAAKPPGWGEGIEPKQ